MQQVSLLTHNLIDYLILVSSTTHYILKSNAMRNYYLLFNSDNKVHIYELQYKDYKWAVVNIN